MHLVFDGVADGPLGVALDIVSTAKRLVHSGVVRDSPGDRALAQRVVSVDGGPVRTGAGRLFSVDGALTLRGLGPSDVLVIPGLGAATEAQVDALLERPDILSGVDLLRRAARKRLLLAASCSATFVLGAAGALDGRQATTTWWLRAAFARRFAKVALCADEMVVRSDAVVTAGAALAHADLMLALVATTVSPSLAEMISKYLLLDGRPSQSRYMVAEHLRSSDPTVRKLEAFVRSNLGRQLSLAEMARATGTAPRTLARRLARALGTTPLHFAHRLRVARAAHLLESTRDSVESIAARVGYADAAAFRRVYRRERGETPGASRR